ncbi:glycerol-3-phosphate dehydrogenase/oxidase [candidate division KSB1 bacterium]|nr:glycerol-3-phosphate dehydrogenase/oxidase [candidate division KSB1 bacterium]RQV99897.1 MAG: glycerol-3-phosphate dehydrogenase/oxidase [candidate division KSB1 bacterium]
MMKRDVEKLTQEEFDLLVVGGGIYGATVAWDAVLRGLKVALIEKRDFAAGTSSNSLKIIHGGLRYLQHADFARMRESIVERRILLKIAPHLVFPMPCIMPTFGHAVKGPEVMRIGLLMNDLFSVDRNRGLDKDHRLPNGALLSKKQLADLIPRVNRDDVNGGALWYDAHMHNSERLLLSFVHSAVEKGAVVANYVKANNLLVKNGRVYGVEARDERTQKTLAINAKLTISTQGPWINELLAEFRDKEKQKIQFSTAINLVLNRQLTREFAFAAPTKAGHKDKDALINTGSRLLFFVPWRGKTLAGTAHKPYYGDAENYRAAEADIQEFLAEVNSALPDEHIKHDEIDHVYAGLLPMAAVDPASGDVTLEKHFRIIDHKKEDNLDGLLSILTVKYTTARGVSKLAVDKAIKILGFGSPFSNSHDIPVWGGNIGHYHKFFADGMNSLDGALTPSNKKHLLATYGSRYNEIVALADEDASLLEPVSSDSDILKAEVIYGVRYEMAQTLSDILMRRTDLGAGCRASAEQIKNVVELMAKELGWSSSRQEQEKQSYRQIYEFAER